MLISVYEGDANEVAEQDLGVLQSSNQQLVQWALKQLLVDLFRVEKHICVHFYLHR